MSTYIIWYRTKAGKLTTVKIQAKTEAEAIRKFKKTVRDTKPFRVLKLKAKSAALSGKRKKGKAKGRKKATRKSRKKKGARYLGKCTKQPADTSSLFGRKKRRKKKAKKSSRLSGTKKRNLVLIPHGDKAKAEALKDKLKNNIIIYGSKKQKRKPKGGAKMRKKEIMETLVKGLTGAGGAVAGSLATNYIPVPENIKPFIPLALGLALPMIPGKGKELKAAASIGLITVGTLILLKKYVPQIPLGLAGEITENDLNLLGMNQDVDTSSIEGEDDFEGEMQTMGAGDFITSADV